MEIHTSLEQAVCDPSLAIITDRITTQKELNKIFVKYKVLPKKARRYSNYYSITLSLTTSFLSKIISQWMN